MKQIDQINLDVIPGLSRRCDQKISDQMIAVKSMVDKRCKKLEKDLFSGTGGVARGPGSPLLEKDKESNDDDYIKMLVRGELDERLTELEARVNRKLREFQEDIEKDETTTAIR